MKLLDYKGFEIHLPESGGKAGKGNNLTTSIQVRRNGYIEKQFRFQVDSRMRRTQALRKAHLYCDNNAMPATITTFGDAEDALLP